MIRNRPLQGDRGSVTAELVIVTPVAFALLCLIALTGRTTVTRGVVDGVARDAARAASFERDPESARRAASESASRSFAASDVRCVSSRVDVDARSFVAGGQVVVAVACEVNLSDLGLIGLGGTRAIAATSVEPIDVYRATSP